MTIQKFTVPPDNSSYGVSDGKEVFAVQLDGGASRYRRAVIGATSTVDVSWILGPDEYKYVRSFYRGITGKGAIPFLIDLILDENFLTEHKAFFIPGSFKLTGQKGLTYWLSAQLEVYPNEDEDNGNFAYVYGELGQSWANFLNLLNSVVNELWPEVL